MANPPDFGRDTTATTSIRTGRLSAGLRLVAEAIFRRITTPRGTLRGGEEEQNYGIDLADLVGSASTKEDEAALPGRIRTECMKDERLDNVVVTVTRTKPAPGVGFTIRIRGITGIGTFDLVLAVSDVTIDIVGLTVGS